MSTEQLINTMSRHCHTVAWNALSLAWFSPTWQMSVTCLLETWTARAQYELVVC